MSSVSQILKIGKINYANLYPIYYCLEKRSLSRNSNYFFISGVPSEINAMLREGKIDIAPSSSIEYLRSPENYLLMDGHSVSSVGPIKSILLFSKEKIEHLHGKTILASFQSETSTALLKIILKKFYGLKSDIIVSNLTLNKGLKRYPAYMLIGDDALIAAQEFQISGDKESNNKLATRNLELEPLYIYDLGAIWHENTGLPFVFALWIAKKECHRERFERFRRDLDRARNESVGKMKEIAFDSPYREILPEEMLISYWNSISYDLTENHLRGLNLFDKYLKELNLIG